MNDKPSCEEILNQFKNKCSRSCLKNGECIQYIQLYLDNMACKNADEYFLDGTKNCLSCHEYFKINDCIKNNLKSKINEICCPEELENRIKNSLSL
ncbi:MAG: hypothetical protein EAZ27_05215 [Cytophagales bacterium]|nr:MAG: hypothetical protein EAZ27_05215 [Cytophagales bacterium]